MNLPLLSASGYLSLVLPAAWVPLGLWMVWKVGRRTGTPSARVHRTRAYVTRKDESPEHCTGTDSGLSVNYQSASLTAGIDFIKQSQIPKLVISDQQDHHPGIR